jgi:hypothetical protein
MLQSKHSGIFIISVQFKQLGIIDPHETHVSFTAINVQSQK